MTDYAKRKRGSMRKLIAVMVIGFLVAGAAIVGAAALYYRTNLKSVSATAETQPFVIEKGATAKEIGANLEETGLIRNATVFDYYLWFNHVRDGLQAGSYQLRPNMTVPEVVGILTHGKVVTGLFTIVPGERIDEVKAAFIKAGFNAQDTESALNPGLYKDHPALADKPADASLEGYLYPESFQKTSETKPEVIVRQSLDQMDKHLTADIKAGIKAQGLTVHQGVTLASIVEREVGKSTDRPMVAQVFLKRLKINMPLQSDATASYGAVLAGLKPTPGYDSVYNTYKHAGLTPGPISNVSVSSLTAVARPATTDYLYFVSGDDGNNYFSMTIEEHERNAAQHCKVKCGR